MARHFLRSKSRDVPEQHGCNDLRTDNAWAVPTSMVHSKCTIFRNPESRPATGLTAMPRNQQLKVLARLVGLRELVRYVIYVAFFYSPKKIRH